MLSLFNGLEIISSAPDKAKQVAESFSRNSNFDCVSRMVVKSYESELSYIFWFNFSIFL